MTSDLHLSTTAVHAGHTPWRGGRPSAPPIVPASGFTYDSMDELDAGLGDDRAGYVYARQNAPTQEGFEAALAALEGGDEAVSFASGMAALHAAIVAACAQGNAHAARVLAAEETYGTTRTLLDNLQANGILTVHYTRCSDPEAVKAAVEQFHPTVLLFEIISNPIVRLADVPALIALAKSVGAQTIIDSTFTTPCLIRPLLHGADFVAHSATKYIAGHGDVLAGIVVSSAANCAAMRRHRNLYGSNLSPFDAWLSLRGLRTLPLRMRQACANALQLARWLSDHPRVDRVYYSGLDTDPHHALAARLFPPDTFGAMLAFDLQSAGRAEVFAVMERLKVARRIASLGDVATLIAYPAHASHRKLSPEARAALGINDNCLRISTGIEDPSDLIADFQQALA